MASKPCGVRNPQQLQICGARAGGAEHAAAGQPGLRSGRWRGADVLSTDEGICLILNELQQWPLVCPYATWLPPSLPPLPLPRQYFPLLSDLCTTHPQRLTRHL